MTLASHLTRPAGRTRPTPTSSRRRAHRKGRVAYAFLGPHLLLFSLFIGYPLIYGIWVSLHEFDLFSGANRFVGLRNYTDLLADDGVFGPLFFKTLRNTMLFVAISTPTLVLAGLGLALLLNGVGRGQTLFRAMFLIPWTLSVSVISLLWWNLLNSTSGWIPHFLEQLGIESPAFLSSMPWAWVSILLATVWWSSGFNTILFLAGLQSVRPELIEAAMLDGAGVWARFRYVTVPELRPIILLSVTLQLIASFNLVAQPQLMTGGGPPPNQTTPALQYIYETGFQGSFALSPAAAMSVVVACIIGAVSVINFRVARAESS